MNGVSSSSCKQHACRVACGGLLLACVFGSPAFGGDRGPPPKVVEQGALLLPRQVAADDGTTIQIEGLSGVSWMGGNRYVAVLDNSRHALQFRLALSADGRPLEASGLSLITLAERHDYEDVVALPGLLALSEEDSPGIHLFDPADGAKIRTLVTPEIFRTRRPNRGFESLAMDVDGRHLWTANEEALVGDGPAAKTGERTVVRLARIPWEVAGREGLEPFRQFAYAVESPHAFTRILGGEAVSGLVAIVPLAADRLLLLERSAGPGLPPFASRMFDVDVGNGRDVAGIESGLADRPEDWLAKRLIWSGSLGANLEGLCLGPPLRGSGDAAAARRSLVGVTDNGGLETPSQVVCFSIEEAPLPRQKPSVQVGEDRQVQP